MPTTPASPAKQAREALGARLREIRTDAGLTGRALAAVVGWHFTKVSRIEHGGQTPSDEGIRAWCAACRADDQIPDLIASVRAIKSMYLEWRRSAGAGMKQLMLSSVPLYERTRLFRIYEHSVIPGLFQTADYSAAILSYFFDFLGIPNDMDAAIAARLERQKVFYTGHGRFVVVLEEQAVRARVGSAGVMTGQLDRLLATMSLPSVSLGIIPQAAERTVFATVDFWMYDDSLVGVETPTAKIEVTQPRELRLYRRLFEQLRESAVYGRPARELINNAIADLQA